MTNVPYISGNFWRVKIRGFRGLIKHEYFTHVIIDYIHVYLYLPAVQAATTNVLTLEIALYTVCH